MPKLFVAFLAFCRLASDIFALILLCIIIYTFCKKHFFLIKITLYRTCQCRSDISALCPKTRFVSLIRNTCLNVKNIVLVPQWLPNANSNPQLSPLCCNFS